MTGLRTLLAIVVVLLVVAAIVAQSTSGQKEIAIRAGRVLDVRTGMYMRGQTIWIEGGRIKEVGSSKDVDPRLPKNIHWIDLSESTVLPGLIDCHTHLTSSPFAMGPEGYHISIPREALIGARNALVTLQAGFTTVRDLGADGFADVALRDAIEARDVRGPRVIASGPMLSWTGGYGDDSFLAPEFHVTLEGVADGVERDGNGQAEH
jgi:imidazolonepropionase-like amidohydrolase